MFSGFNLTLNKDFFQGKPMSFDTYRANGENHLKSSSEKIMKNLNQFMKKDSIDGSKLQNEWFPEIEADIFISHSHQDCTLANALAGWINCEFGLKVFVDSNIWGYSDILLEDINSKYSNKQYDSTGGISYDHYACNAASKHVNTMLSIALQQMIDKIECIILLNTENSVNVFDNEKIETTYSPWIYSEMVCSRIVRKKPLWNYRCYRNMGPMFESTYTGRLMYSLLISYNVNLDHLVEIESESLDEWLKKFKSCADNEYKDYPLDALYEFSYQNDLSKTKELFKTFGFQSVEEMKQTVLKNEVTMEQFLFNNNFKCCDLYRNCSRCNFKDFKCTCLNERSNNTDD